MLSPDRQRLVERRLSSSTAHVDNAEPIRIPVRDRARPAPLSHAQRRLWFMDQIAPGSAFYNVPVATVLEGPLDLRALQHAVNEIVRRHEVLRTTFPLVASEPVQAIADEATVPLASVDVSARPPDERRAEAQRLADAEARRPFNLTTGPVARATLLRLAECEHWLLLTLHHIVADGWSMGILAREITTLYRAFHLGRPSPLPDLPIQYADFAAWQREWLQGTRLDRQLTYWRTQLADLSPLPLVTDRPRPAQPTFDGAFHPMTISDAAGAAVRSLATAAGATPFMVLLAAFDVLLYRYTNHPDVVVGAPIANRTHRDVEDLIGFFVNTLVLRANVSGNPTFHEMVQRVRTLALDAYANQDVPFEQLVDTLHPARDLARNPLFQVGFVLQTAWNMDQGAGSPRDHASRQLDVHRGTAIFDLAVHLWDRQSGFDGGIEYATALFDPGTIARLAGHFTTLLEAAVHEPDTRVDDLPLLRPHERQRVLVGWNGTAAPFDEGASLPALLERHAAARPNAAALSSPGGILSYRDLNEQVDAVASALRARGCARGSFVILSGERSATSIIGLLAIMKAGAAYVPIDPSDPVDRLRIVIEDTGAACALANGGSAPALERLMRDSGVELLRIDDLRAAPAARARTPAGAAPDDLAYVIYTSGTTGRPKGVMVEHRGLANVAMAQRQILGVEPDSRVLQFASLTFDASVFEIALAVGSGGTLCIPPAEAQLPGPALVDYLGREQISIVTLPPSALAALPREALPDLRTITVAGESCPAHLVGWADGRRRFFNLYGPTETTIWATVAECVDPSQKPPIGRPIANTRLYVLDERSRPVPVGVPGELFIAGVGLARGYLNRPELSADRFVSTTVDGDRVERLYRTGDRVRFLANGDLDFLGRTDHQVKVRGYRIELEEIEGALREYPGLHDAAAIAREDAPGDRRLVAYVTPSRSIAAVDEPAERELSAELVSHWRRLYDDLYADGAPADATFNITGWNSSYTGEAISAAEMREWLDRTVERILALEPRRIFEIGGGAGLLLFRLAPSCETYTYTDVSAAAIAYVTDHLARLPDVASRVRLSRAEAGELPTPEPDRHDVVVLNSVVQYFPSAEYLRRVLAVAVRSAAPRGSVFLGDVRNLALLETFGASVEVHLAQEDATVETLRERVARRVMLEQELLVDPEFFYALQAEYPEIADVEILVKGGTHHNELTRFRYDVVLRIGSAPARGLAAPIDWSGESALIERLDEHVRRHGRTPVHVRHIPNARIAGDLALRAALAELEPTATVHQIRERAGATAAAVDPEWMNSLGARFGYRVELRHSRSGGPGAYDALLHPDVPGNDAAELPAPPAAAPAGAAMTTAGPYAQFTNRPLRGIFLRTMVPRLRAFLEARLPSYSIPSQYVLLDRLPRTASGKVDRTRLPAPERSRPALGIEYVAPASGIEDTLAAIWRDVLDVNRVGIHDNFFELGGDSILGIQIVARARSAGLELSPRHLFEHQTIAELVPICAGTRMRGAEQGTLVGEVALTPIQHWFFEQAFDEPHHFNQSVVLPLVEPLDAARLAAAAQHLVSHHDALRLHFEHASGAWRQRYAAADAPVTVQTIDLSHVTDRERHFEMVAAQVSASFDLAAPPHLRLARVDLGRGEACLLIVAHHLVIDAVSWRILLEDLRTVYAQLERGEAVSLPPKTTSYRQWAERLVRYAHSAATARAADYWATAGSDAAALPIDHDLGPNTVASMRTVAVELDAAATTGLLKRLPERFKTSIHEALVAALVTAVCRWSGRRSALIDIEGHGREDLFEGMDLSRTVGWFTAIVPVRLDIGAVNGPDEILLSIKEQLRAVPDRGLTFGALRYLSSDERVRAALAAVPQPEIAFNYLGRFGREGESAPEAAERHTAGPARSPHNRRRHLLEVNARVLNGRLSIDVSYSENRHQRSTIARVADDAVSTLRELAAIAEAPGRRQYSASDFSKARLSPQDFGRLIAQLGNAPRRSGA